jgi:hypothetical protein
VLKEAGLHATVDGSGVTVNPAEQNRAREVMLTDKRLAGTDILVMLFVPAASARKTDLGFEIASPTPTQTSPATSIPNAAEWLARPDVQSQFRARSTPAAYAEFEKLLSTADDTAAQTSALQMVLFSLKKDELSKLGINQTEQPDGPEWFIAGWTAGPASGEVDKVFTAYHITPLNVLDLGMVGSYVPRAQFFQARDALLASPKIASLNIQIATPHLPVP